MKTKIAVVLAAALLLAGCEQVQALISPPLKCHDLAIRDTLAAKIKRKAAPQINLPAERIPYAEFLLKPNSFHLNAVAEIARSDTGRRACTARLEFVGSQSGHRKLELLSQSAFQSALANEVLGIQGLRQSGPAALQFPPQADEFGDLYWNISYEVDKSSDRKSDLVQWSEGESDAVASFMALYVTSNEEPQ